MYIEMYVAEEWINRWTWVLKTSATIQQKTIGEMYEKDADVNTEMEDC